MEIVRDDTTRRKGEAEVKKRRSRLIPAAAALLCVFLAGIIAVKISRNVRVFRSAELTATLDLGGGNGVSWDSFGKYMLRWSQNGIACLDAEGKEKWNRSFSMSAPYVRINGEYGVIGDREGGTLFLFQSSGINGEIELNKPLLGMAVSAGGSVVVSVDEGTATRILYYDKTGKRLDIELLMEMAISGYPVDMALSPDGTGLAVSCTNFVGGELTSQIVFYNFSVGKGTANRLVAYFEYNDCIFPELEYLSGSNLMAAGDEGILFFSLNNELKPSLTTRVEPEGEFMGICTGEGYTAVLQTSVNGEAQLSLYSASGREIQSRKLDGNCRFMDISGGYLLAETEKQLVLWDMKGKERLNAPLRTEGSEVYAVDLRTLLQMDGEKVNRYRLR